MQSTRRIGASRRHRRRQGVTTVEVAITFPIVILLVMLIFEMSRIMMVQQSLAFAAQQGSRTASLATTLAAAQVESAVQSAMAPVIPNNASVVDVNITPSTFAGVGSGTEVVVNLQVSLDDVSWVPGTMLSFLGNPTLTAQAVQDRE